MVEMKNLIKEADANPKVNHLGLWRTDLAYFWVINCDAKIQDDMHYHENDDHIFMVIEGECTVRTPHKEFVLKQFDTVLLKSGEPYQLCNTGNGRMLLLGAGNAGVDGKPRTLRVIGPRRRSGWPRSERAPDRRQAAHARTKDPEPHPAIRAGCSLK